METLVKMEKIEKPNSPDTQTQTSSSVTPFSIADILTRMERRSPDVEVSSKEFRLSPDHAKALANLRNSTNFGFRPVSVLKYNMTSPMDLTKENSHEEVSSSVENINLRYPNLQRVRSRDDLLSSADAVSRSRSGSPCSDVSIDEEHEIDTSDKEDSSLIGDGHDKTHILAENRNGENKGEINCIDLV